MIKTGDNITIRGARVHNLKSIDLDIPRNKLVVITGISGSGKSSLAFDTIYAEGQRRYVESLSAYARQFLGVMQKPDVDRIDGLSPAISIDQRSVSKNPRSTVGTTTEIYDYVRLLFARIGKPHCPNCGKPVTRQSVSQISDQILNFLQNSQINILAPIIKDKKGEHKNIIEGIQRAGYVRTRVDGLVYRIEESLNLKLDRYKKHNIEVVVDRLVIDKYLDRSRVADSVETALKLGNGVVIINQKYKSKIKNNNIQKNKSIGEINSKLSKIGEDRVFSEHFACIKCGISLPEIEPRTFSFNSPHGACPACTGLGSKQEVEPELVIPNKNLTLAEGAIRPWASASHRVGRQGWFWRQLEDLGEKHGFSTNVPVKELSKKAINFILYGDEEFGGVIPSLERRWRETDSDWTRAEIEKYMVIKKCPKCSGKRLRPEALAVTVAGVSIDNIVEMSISEVKRFFESFFESRIKNQESRRDKFKSKIHDSLFIIHDSERKIATPIVKEIVNRLRFLVDVGLDYLTLDRESVTLAGGEAQRIRLATQIGSKLVGVTYILDEPSIGLHPRDQGRLIETLKILRDLGNSVIVVEHDPQTIKSADWVIDIGPGAGENGGRVMFEGTPKELLRSKILTGEYLSGRKKVKVYNNVTIKQYNHKNKKKWLNGSMAKWLEIRGASEHNLKDIDVRIPLGKFICITGVSGSGKSTLMNDILAKALLREFYRVRTEPGKYKEISGIENLDKAIIVDQSPIGRTPRSNPATYTGVFTYIRDLFSKTREARIRGYKLGRFSFNVKGGRCEFCEGQGYKKIEMHFLSDVYVECEECRGTRYNKEALDIEYRGINIAEVLKMTVDKALLFFKNIPAIQQKLKTIKEVGLGYIELGQPAPTLSGGEAQRVKLATELARKSTGQTLYILDEPTTGLHFDDINKLLNILISLVSRGNTVLVIEHNLDLIRNADWIIDLGPEGGEKGGDIIAEGTPKEIAKIKQSYTGQYLSQNI